VKNLNSIRNVQRAIEHEFARQIAVVENGGHIDQNTLNFDANTGETSVLRTKEMANDYRYFPEPDLPPLVLTQEYLDKIRAEMPALPEELYQKYIGFGLSEYDATVITADHHVAQYFEEVIKHTSNYKSAANWLMGSLKTVLDDDSAAIALKPADLAAMIELVDSGKINHTTAAHKLLPELLKGTDKTVQQITTELNLFITDNSNEVEQFIQEALSKFPDKVVEYRKGKKGVIGLFMGEIMKRSKGKIDPKKTNQLLIKALETN